MPVITQKDNATKRIAQPLLDAKRKCRTKAEIEADKQHLEEERQKAEVGRQAGNEHIAGIQDRQALEAVKMKVGARLQARLVQPTSKGQPSIALPAQDPTGNSMGVDVLVPATMTTDAGRKDKEVPVQLGKVPRKMTHHDAADALRQEAQALSQFGSLSDTHGSANLKIIDDGQDNDPKEVFLGCMKEWITDVDKNGKPIRPSAQRISSNIASSTCVSSLFNPIATSTTAISSTASAPKPPPSCSPTPFEANAEDEPPAALLDDDDDVECDAAHSLVRFPTVDSLVLQDKEIDYTQPPFTQIPPVSPASVKDEPVNVPIDITFDFSDDDDDPIIINAPTTLMGWKWAMTFDPSDNNDDLINIDAPTTILVGRKQATTVQAGDHSDAPSSKHLRTKPSSVPDRNPVESSTRKVKYNNSHIPQGAKWSRMLNMCWGTKASSEVKVLQLLWNIVYKDKIPTTIQTDGPIHAVATQRITEWRGGFASASIIMIHNLINSNDRFNTPETQSELARFWLEGNCFLFEDAAGETVKDYKGMWKSRFILQTFAAHLHFIQGAMHIPIKTGLKDNKCSYPKAALVLAGVAVKQTFILLRDKALTFEVIPPTGKGKKKATRSNKWKANISGEMFKKDFWGHETVRFMQSIERIPPAVWDNIIKASLQLVKETLWKSGCGTLNDDEDDNINVPSDDDDKLTDLMTYR